MNKKEIKEWLRSKCPNIPALRKMLAKKRIEIFRSNMMSEQERIDGEKSYTRKEVLVRLYEKKFPRFIEYTVKTIEHLFANAPSLKNRENLDKLRVDMLFCRYAYGFQPDEYLCFELEDKSMEARQAFVSDIERLCYVYQMNDIIDVPVFNNKALTYEMFAPYYHRDAVSLKSKKDYDKFLEYVKKHPVFVKKAVFEAMGRSVELVDLSANEMGAEAYFSRLIANGTHILEEKVDQAAEMAVLNESSVNTVRCITMNTKHGIEIAYCFLKAGRNGSFVDNAGAGGIVAGVDNVTGMVHTDGFDELNNRYQEHPDTHVVFQGFQLPAWDEMIKICKEMSAQTPTIKYIGWDMAYAKTGWVVIEGNGMSQMIIPQIVNKRGIKQEVLSLMSDMELYA